MNENHGRGRGVIRGEDIHQHLVGVAIANAHFLFQAGPGGGAQFSEDTVKVAAIGRYGPRVEL